MHVVKLRAEVFKGSFKALRLHPSAQVTLVRATVLLTVLVSPVPAILQGRDLEYARTTEVSSWMSRKLATISMTALNSQVRPVFRCVGLLVST